MVKGILIHAYQTFAEYNQTDLAGIFTYPAHILPMFIPMILFGFFCVIFLASFFAQKRLTGEGDFANSFASAGFLTMLMAFVMSLTEGLITIQTLSITFAVGIVSIIVLILSKQ